MSVQLTVYWMVVKGREIREIRERSRSGGGEGVQHSLRRIHVRSAWAASALGFKTIFPLELSNVL